jgi:YcxB-like protein
MLTLEFELTEEEFLKYNYYTAWQEPEKKLYRVRYYLGFLLLYIAITISLLYIPTRELTTFSIITIAAGVAVLSLFIRFRLRASFDRNARKMIRDSGPDKILTRTELTLSENGIAGKTKIAEVKYSWEAFKKKVVINDCCYLYVNTRQAVVIPLRAFSVPEQKDQFDKLLAEYLPLQAKFESAS